MLSADAYLAQGSARVEHYHRGVAAIIAAQDEPRRSALRRMFDGPLGTQFMTAPASTRRAYHNAYPCGLAAHSLAVSANVVRVADTMAPGRWRSSQLMLYGLLHDLGKAGVPGTEHYREVTEEWKRRRGEFYETNPACPYMDVSQRTLFLLQSHGVPLEHEEYLALALADGQYVDRNRDYRLREPLLAVIVHTADLWTMTQEKESDR